LLLNKEHASGIPWIYNSKVAVWDAALFFAIQISVFFIGTLELQQCRNLNYSCREKIYF